jgi:hypothetical protein
VSELGVGPGWDRLSAQVAERVPTGEIDGIWVFLPIRQGQREYGTAIVSQVHGERRRIYTGRYMLQIKGKERGKFEAAVEEVGSGPLEALADLLQDVRKRIQDEEPPVPIPVETWYPDRVVETTWQPEAAADPAHEEAPDSEPVPEPEPEPEPEAVTEDDGTDHQG